MKNKIISIAFAIILIGTSCKPHTHENQETEKFTATYPLKKDTIINHKYVCQIHAIQHIELRAIEKGYLEKILIDEGKFVKQGQLLFQTLPTIYQAEVQKSTAEVNYIEIEYENTKNLFDKNIVSKNELALAKAKLDKAKAELKLAQTHFGFSEIRAPFSGIIDHFRVRLGSLLDEGELLTTLSDNSKMWIYFNVPEAEYLNYATHTKSDSAVKVFLQMANNEIFKYAGKVETIEADFNNETGNIAFRATFPNPDKILRHGGTGNILMPVNLKNALLIPQKATFEVLDKKYVYVIDKNNIIQSREITISAEMPHLYAVSSGLQETDKILVDGLRKVKNEQKVEYTFIPQQKIIDELYHLHAE